MLSRQAKIPTHTIHIPSCLPTLQYSTYYFMLIGTLLLFHQSLWWMAASRADAILRIRNVKIIGNFCSQTSVGVKWVLHSIRNWVYVHWCWCSFQSFKLESCHINLWLPSESENAKAQHSTILSVWMNYITCVIGHFKDSYVS